MEFVNSMLQTPLPVDALGILVDMLELSEEQSTLVHQPSNEVGDLKKKTSNEVGSTITPPLAAAHQSTQIAENLLRMTHLLFKLTSNSPGRLQGPDAGSDPSNFYAAPSGATQAFHDAVHQVLLQVMAERDESHARMVAAGVLHVHETEQLRKQVSRLKAQIKAGSETPDHQDEKAQQLKNEMQQDSDMELVSLCQQLAGEISARTNASLEVIRLKESRKIERDTEEAEKNALLREAIEARQALTKERERAENAERQMEEWKASYESLVRAQQEKILEGAT